MRHRKAGRKLKRTASHRRATLAALSTSLLRHKKITTTVAKAKETRVVVEKLITKAKRALSREDGAGKGDASDDRMTKFLGAAGHARREVGRLIRDRAVVSELFSAIVPKVGSRPGGYTRIVKLGQRQGDGAEMAVIELVDFNTGQEAAEKPPSKEKKAVREKKTTKGRARKAKGESSSQAKEKDEGPGKRDSSSAENKKEPG
jgi:large subunit ribosomal protein L17